MMEEHTNLDTLPAELIILIAKHLLNQENIDSKRLIGTEHVLCGCGEKQEGTFQTRKLLGKGHRFHSDVLKFASLSRRFRDILFEENKPECISLPFYRSAVIACKWMRQDLLDEVKMLRIITEEDALASFHDASSILIMKDFLAPFRNLARLEIDWTHLDFNDSRLSAMLDSGLLEYTLACEDSVERFANFDYVPVPKYAMPSLTSLQIKTRSKAWERARICPPSPIDPVSQPLWALRQIQMPNIRNLHWTHSYEYQDSEGDDWRNVLQHCAERQWPLESLTLCLTVEEYQLQSGYEQGSVLEAILFDAVSECGGLGIHIDLRARILNRRTACRGTLEELIETNLQHLQSELPTPHELSNLYDPQCVVPRDLRITFTIWGQIPFVNDLVPLLTITHRPETHQDDNSETGIWTRHFIYTFHQPDIPAMVKRARETSWQGSDDEGCETFVYVEESSREESEDSNRSAALSDSDFCFPQYEMPVIVSKVKKRLSLSEYIHSEIGGSPSLEDEFDPDIFDDVLALIFGNVRHANESMDDNASGNLSLHLDGSGDVSFNDDWSADLQVLFDEA